MTWNVHQLLVILSITVKITIGLDVGTISMLEGLPQKDELDKSTGIDDIIRAIDELNSVLDISFLISGNRYQKLPGVESFTDSVIDLLYLFDTINNDFKNTISYKDALDEGVDGAVVRATEFAKIMDAKYYQQSPFDRISTLISNTFFAHLVQFGGACVSGMSPLQLVTRLFQKIQWASVEFHMTTDFVYSTLDKYEIFDVEVLDEARSRFNVLRISEIYDAIVYRLTDKLDGVSKAMYACGQSSRNDTILELPVFRRVFLEHCSEEQPIGYNNFSKLDCSRIASPPHDICDASRSMGTCSVWQSCKGRIKCENLKDNATVCLGESGGNHVYDQYSLMKERNLTCTNSHRLFASLIVRTRSPLLQPETRTVRECEPCKCICQEERYYFNIGITQTETAANMVVTGAKLQILNDTLFVIVQQGKILPSGMIDSNTTRWLPHVMGRKEEISLEGMTTFDLTRAKLDPGQVMTGLGFWTESVDARTHIRLVALSTKYDSVSGKLSGELQFHKSNTGRSELEPTDRGPAPNTIIKHARLNQRKKFVRFTTSSGADGGRSTIPFINIQDVVPSPQTPFSGAGLYLRNEEKLGVFVGIELLTYNVRLHIPN